MTFDPYAPECIECGTTATLVGGESIYPHRPDLFKKSFYLCPSCGAYCGCHPKTNRALGYPAGPKTRNARSYVHRILDPIWQNAGEHYNGDPPSFVRRMARTRVYKYLANEMGLTKDECHTGMFTIEQCRQAYAILKKTDYPKVRAWFKANKAEATG
ncbi:MAG: zinc-finger-containing protein [Pseudomonadota bacterium]